MQVHAPGSTLFDLKYSRVASATAEFSCLAFEDIYRSKWTWRTSDRAVRATHETNCAGICDLEKAPEGITMQNII